jgi:transposase
MVEKLLQVFFLTFRFKDSVFTNAKLVVKYTLQTKLAVASENFCELRLCVLFLVRTKKRGLPPQHKNNRATAIGSTLYKKKYESALYKEFTIV